MDLSFKEDAFILFNFSKLNSFLVVDGNAVRFTTQKEIVIQNSKIPKNCLFSWPISSKIFDIFRHHKDGFVV